MSYYSPSAACCSSSSTPSSSSSSSSDADHWAAEGADPVAAAHAAYASSCRSTQIR